MKNNKLIVLLILISFLLPHRTLSMQMARNVIRYLTGPFTAQQSDDNFLPVTTQQLDNNSLPEALDIVRKSPPVLQELMLDYLNSWEREQDIKLEHGINSACFLPTQELILNDGRVKSIIDPYGIIKPRRINYQTEYFTPTMDPTKAANEKWLSNACQDILASAFSADGSIAATSNYDKKLKLWSLIDRKPLRTLRVYDFIEYVEFAKNNLMLLSLSLGGVLKLWTFETDARGKTIKDPQKTHRHPLKLCGPALTFNAIDFRSPSVKVFPRFACPEGSQIASASVTKGTIEFLDTQTRVCTQTLNATSGDGMRIMELSPDSFFMVSATHDNATLWSNRKRTLASLLAKEQHEEKN